MKKSVFMFLLICFLATACSVTAPEYAIENSSTETAIFTVGVKTSEKINLAPSETKKIASYYQMKLFFIPDDGSFDYSRANDNDSKIIIEAKKFPVTFVFDNGEENAVVKVDKGATVKEPTAPQKPEKTFDGWFAVDTVEAEIEGTAIAFDFETKITKGTILKAKWN